MGKTQVNLQIDEDQKEDWEEYIEESGRYNSLSGLIRGAVEAEISGEGAAENVTSPAMENDIQTMMEDIERVRKDVRWLREQEQDAVDISDLAQDLFDELETLPEPESSIEIPSDVEDEETYRKQRAASIALTPDGPGEKNPQTASALAERLGTTEDRIQDAVDHLQDQYLPIVAVEMDGETHYFEEP
jgi:hypothetical protein